MAQFFGYRHGTTQHWLNLDYVVSVAFDESNSRVDAIVAKGVDGVDHTPIQLSGNQAVAFEAACRLLGVNKSLGID